MKPTQIYVMYYIGTASAHSISRLDLGKGSIRGTVSMSRDTHLPWQFQDFCSYKMPLWYFGTLVN